jgi:hypothetical protein
MKATLCVGLTGHGGETVVLERRVDLPFLPSVGVEIGVGVFEDCTVGLRCEEVIYDMTDSAIIVIGYDDCACTEPECDGNRAEWEACGFIDAPRYLPDMIAQARAELVAAKLAATK